MGSVIREASSVFSEFDIDKSEFMAVVHAIAKHTIGLSIQNGRYLGCGTLIERNSERFILTALHNLENAMPSDMRYFLTPPGNMKEGPMRNQLPDLMALSPGIKLPVNDSYLADRSNDIAAIPFARNFILPDGSSFYVVEDARMEISAGASVMLVGYPVANNVPIGHNRAVGMISEHAKFDPVLNIRTDLSSSYDAKRHFLMPYAHSEDPGGISGTGVWCNQGDETRKTVWKPRPKLAGVQTDWYRTQRLLRIVRIDQVYKMLPGI